MDQIWRNLQQPQQLTQKWIKQFDMFEVTLNQYEKTTKTRKDFSYLKPNVDATFQQSDGRTQINITDAPIDLENKQPLLQGGDDESGGKNGGSSNDISRGTYDASNKNRYANIENESERPRGRKYGHIRIGGRFFFNFFYLHFNVFLRCIFFN
uniref:Uncharacterized protein n=1 Tax=Lactuca sativa TaxID=4236 RepID=A0A9R1XT27_LACSA|nr:hypothetical protein LSAT_V11C300117340 [Lactuca sativa]